MGYFVKVVLITSPIVIGVSLDMMVVLFNGANWFSSVVRSVFNHKSITADGTISLIAVIS